MLNLADIDKLRNAFIRSYGKYLTDYKSSVVDNGTKSAVANYFIFSIAFQS